MSLKKIICILLFYLFLIGLASCDNRRNDKVLDADKDELLTLEQKWLTTEFALDTAYLSSIMDSSFIDISGEGIHTKSQSLLGMYKNISQRIRDSIFVDSFRIENPVINIYQNSAVVCTVIHTFRNEKGVKTEHKTRFYDVWIKQNNSWKAVASQGTIIE